MFRVGCVLAAATLLAGCGASFAPTVVPSIAPPTVVPSLVATTMRASIPPSATPSATAAATPSATAAATPAAIVGVWRGEHQCEGIAQALQDAGFDETVIIENIVGNGLLRAVDSLDDIAEACG